MPIEQQINRYELLVRFNVDGTLSGAHQKARRIVTDTDAGEVLADQVMPAEPVDPATVSDVLEEHQVAISNQVLALAAERDAALARVAELEAQLADG